MLIRPTRLFVFLFLLLFTASFAQAQKKDLTLEDYAQWERITTQVLSHDGAWFAYQIAPVEGDGWLTIKRIAGDEEHRFDHAVGHSFLGKQGG